MQKAARRRADQEDSARTALRQDQQLSAGGHALTKGKSGEVVLNRTPTKGKSGDAEATGSDKKRDKPKESALGKRRCHLTKEGEERQLIRIKQDVAAGGQEGDDGCAEHSVKGDAMPKMDADIAAVAATTGSKAGLRAVQSLPRAILGAPRLLSGGGTVAARRRQRRREAEIAALHEIMVAEFRERQEERAKVLRLMVRRTIEALRGTPDVIQHQRYRGEVAVAVTAVRRTERRRQEIGVVHGTEPRVGNTVEKATTTTEPHVTDTTGQPVTRAMTEKEWLSCLRRYEEAVPEELVEQGTLAEMRAIRAQAAKEAKHLRAARRVRRLQRNQARQDAVANTARAAGQAVKAKNGRSKPLRSY
ncbi:hypothetical protein PF003_g18187 [Phytophthora fragariae]|nr:hypothetical protein PF003_g18187 [Phytophthora fragariae]